MIPYEHDVPHLEVGIQSSSSICDNQDLHPQEKEHPDGKGDLQNQKHMCNEYHSKQTATATTFVISQFVDAKNLYMETKQPSSILNIPLI